MKSTALETVTGRIEAVGTKFNGSVLVKGQWYNFSRDVKNTAGKGDLVTLTLEPWEAKGKHGVNITKLEFAQDPAEVANQMLTEATAAVKEARQDTSVGRDFNAENRGKVRHGLMVAALPLILTETVTITHVESVIDALVEYVMTGK